MERYYVVFDTDDFGLLLHCSSGGNVMLTDADANDLNPWNIFPTIMDLPTLEEALEIFDPKGAPRKRRLMNVIDELIKDDAKLQKLSVEINGNEVTVYGLPMKNKMRDYLTATCDGKYQRNTVPETQNPVLTELLRIVAGETTRDAAALKLSKVLQTTIENAHKELDKSQLFYDKYKDTVEESEMSDEDLV